MIKQKCEGAPAQARAHLSFEPSGGRTVASQCLAQSPLKILLPRRGGSAAWACASSHGGGLLSGDDILIEIDVCGGAAAAFTTQASTKIYPGPRPARQSVTARVGPAALLAVLPDPVAPFAGSRYEQRQAFELADSASLAVVDWLTAGRPARKERWAFASYESRLEIRRDGKDVLWDAVRLDSEPGPVAARMGRFNLLAVAAACGPALAPGARAVVEALSTPPAKKRASAVVCASPLGEDGVLIRLAAESIEQGTRRLRELLSFVWAALGEDPWSRRP